MPELIGIAKMAAQSELLEAKSEVEYFEIAARSILNRTKPNMPFQWTINPYRGCEFGCQYCYARYTHEFMGMQDGRDFESKIYAKAAAPGNPAPRAAQARSRRPHRHRHRHRSVSARRAALRAHPRHPGSLRRREGPPLVHHHQVGPGRARRGPAARDRAPQCAVRQHHRHHAQPPPGAPDGTARAAARSAAGRRPRARRSRACTRVFSRIPSCP